MTPKVTAWQITMLVLSVYVLGALFTDTVFTLPSETSALLTRIDNLVCLLFIADFIFSLCTARDRLGYLKWGWIDLLSSIPNVRILRWGRVFRAIRILRILRGIRSTKLILKFLFASRAKGTLGGVATVSLVLLIFASIAILNCETSAGSNIKTASDALWWAFGTLTTVGYGDLYPVTVHGRLIAALLIMAGIGLYATFTAYVASVFVHESEKEGDEREDTILAELKIIKERLDGLEKKSSIMTQ